MKLLIIYGTTEGHTRNIANFLKTEAEKKGIHVTLCDSTNSPEPPLFYHGVVVLSSLHAHRYQSSVYHYAKSYAEHLNKVPSAFLSVSLTAADEDDAESWKELKKITTEFLEHANWQPASIEYVAGALLYAQYDFFKGLVMKMIGKSKNLDLDTTKDYVFTDWHKLEVFLGGFTAEMEKQKDKVGATEEYL